MSGLLNNPEEGAENMRRTVLAVLIVFGIFFVFSSVVTPPPPQPGEGSAAAAVAEGTADAAATDDAALVAAPVEGSGADAPPMAGVDALPPQLLAHPSLLDEANDAREGAILQFTNVGARLADVEIVGPTQYRPHPDMAGVFPEPTDPRLPLAVLVEGLPDLHDAVIYRFDEERSHRIGRRDGADVYDELAYTWTAPDGTIEVTRRYVASTEAFGTDMFVDITNLSAVERRFGGVEVRVTGDFDPEASTGGITGRSASALEALCSTDGKVKRRLAQKLDEPLVRPGAVGMIGVDERYFVTGLAPGDGVETTGCGYMSVGSGGDHIRASLDTVEFVLPPEGTHTLQFALFTGPKDTRYLEAVDADLLGSVDFGMFSFLALPIRWLLLLFQSWVINWGVAIILLTVFIKLLLFPITQKSFQNMEKMRVLQPQLQELQKKYENDRMKLAEEQMKLFRESGTSPLGGCLPMVLQMPIYFALYRTIWGSTELYNAPFFGWITDLSQRDPIFVLPILMGVTMLVQQGLMPQSIDNPQMKMVQRIMPVMFTVMMLFLPSGLVLYIFVNMLLSIAQQLLIRRRMSSASS